MQQEWGISSAWLEHSADNRGVDSSNLLCPTITSIILQKFTLLNISFITSRENNRYKYFSF